LSPDRSSSSGFACGSTKGSRAEEKSSDVDASCLRYIKQDLRAKTLRALVCDDSPVCLKQLGKIMADLGYSTDLFYDCDQAMAHLTKHHDVLDYDVMVTDLHMPVHRGLNFIKKCRGLLGRKLPIAVVSSYSINEAEVLQAGADCFLEKPVSRKHIPDVFSSFTDACLSSTSGGGARKNRVNFAESSTHEVHAMLCDSTLDILCSSSASKK